QAEFAWPSRRSVWHSSFCGNPEASVALQLKDECHVHGWPREWPSTEGDIKLENSVWLDVDGGERKEVEIPGSSLLKAPATSTSISAAGSKASSGSWRTTPFGCPRPPPEGESQIL